MNRTLRILPCLTVALVFLCVSTDHPADAHRPRRTGYVLIGWECSGTVNFNLPGFARMINMAQKEASHGDPRFDKAVLLDLNGDGAKEYLVPFDCGGTGNCDWAVFSASPRRFLGVVAGQYLYVESLKGCWPQIKTYTHMGASEGVIATYRFDGRRYRWLGDEKPVSVEMAGVPKDLAAARNFCELEWNPKYLNEARR